MENSYGRNQFFEKQIKNRGDSRELQGGKKGNKHMFLEIPGDLKVDEVFMQNLKGR